MQKYNSRNEVPEKYKWDLTDFFKDENDFNQSLEKANKLVENLKNYIGCTKNNSKLYEYLKKEIEALALCEDIYVYAYLINDQELGISTSMERKNKAILLNSKLEANTSFFGPELLKLNKDEYNQLYDNKKLEEFKFYLDSIYREKEHILTENEEKIVSEIVNSMNHYDDISSTMLNSEHDYGKIELEDNKIEVIATNNYRSLLKNESQDIRKKVYEQFNRKISQYINTSASLLNSYVNMNNTVSKIRHFKSSWERKLFELNISENVFKTLVKSVEKNLSPLHKYYKLRKEVLKLDKLHCYDLRIDMSHSNKEYTIEEAQEIIRNALKPLGDKYLEKYEKIIKNRYIDYCQYKGKCSGGYSFSTLDKDSRILMSYNGDLTSISTIIHEAGHNINKQFMKEKNLLQYCSNTPLVAEVASLTNECLLSHYIVNNAESNAEKLVGLENIIDVIISNLFGAVREGKMEEDMYQHSLEGLTLTADYMNKITINSLKKYYGDNVEIDEYAKNSWVNRSHYYMNFYLYSYAVCISVAINVASKILEGDQKMLSKYIKFLEAGCDSWSKETFEILGIDLEDEKVYEHAIQYFDSLLEEFKKIYYEVEV